MMEISTNGLNLIKQFEGFSSKPYKDIAGYLTIGYGHLIKRGEKFTFLTEEAATQLLDLDVDSFELAVNNKVHIELNQNQFDALVSLIYNIGIGNFSTSTLLKELNSGNIDKAAEQFLVWNRAGGKISLGLINRRKKERDLFLSLL